MYHSLIHSFLWLLQEVTSRGERKRRSDGAPVPTRSDGRRTMTEDTAEALRRLLRSTITASSMASTRRVWNAGSRPRSHMAVSSAAELVVNPTRGLAPLSGTPWLANPPAPDDDNGLDIHDPLFNAYYGDTNEFGTGWTSRYGMSPPPPAPSLPTEPNPPPSTFYSGAFTEDWSIPPAASATTVPGSNNGPTSSSNRAALLDRLVIARQRERERTLSRASDFATYSARRRAVQRRDSRGELNDAQEPSYFAPLSPPALEVGGLEYVDRRARFHSAPYSHSNPPDYSYSEGFGLSSPPRSWLAVSPPPPPASVLAIQTRSPILPAVSLSHFSASVDIGVRPESPSPAPASAFTAATATSQAASFDDLRHRLEAYPRRGSTGPGSTLPFDDQLSRAGPSSLSILPPPSPTPRNAAALLLTQGRTRSRSRSSSPPVLFSSTSNPSLRESSSSSSVSARPLRRQNLRVPEILDALDSSSSSSPSPSSPSSRFMRRHGSLPSNSLPYSPSNLSSSLLGDGAGMRYRSPLPMSPHLNIELTSETVGAPGEREGSVPPPVVQLTVTRSATPDMA